MSLGDFVLCQSETDSNVSSTRKSWGGSTNQTNSVVDAPGKYNLLEFFYA